MIDRMISIRQDETRNLEDYEESEDYSHREFRSPWAFGNTPRTSRRMQPDYRARIFDKPLDFHHHRPAAWPHTFCDLNMERSEKNRMAFLITASKLGWEVVFEDDNGIQIKRRRRYSPMIMMVGLVLLLFGIGILVWIYGFIDIQMKNDDILYVLKSEFEKETMDQIVTGLE